MAIIKKNVLGTFQGSLSDIVLRVRNGKVVAYAKPTKQRVSRTKSALIARYRFALTVALAKEINRNEILSKIWSQTKIKATNSYQKLIKVNSPFTEPQSLSIRNKITPDGIPLKDVAIQTVNNFLELTIDLSKIDKQLLKSNKLFCLIHLWNKKDDNKKNPSKPDFVLELFSFELSDLDKNSTLNFLIDIMNLNKPRFNSGLALIALTGNRENKFFYSSTFGIKFN